MKILVAVICCEYKLYSLNECLSAIEKAGFDDVLLNYEGEQDDLLDISETKFSQIWQMSGSGVNKRQFDQDQNARLTPICIARNMCLDFAQQGGYDWIFFVDSDVIIPEDTKEKLFTEPEFGKLRSGIVPGRGCHSSAKYMFYPNEKVANWQRADYFTCGFMAIHKDIFFRLRFRWGLPIGEGVICSEDPLFGSDARTILNEFWWGNLDLIARHSGDLKQGETSQF
jgi:lipopolysaccharide biosynthesis glycosyltransferase